MFMLFLLRSSLSCSSQIFAIILLIQPKIIFIWFEILNMVSECHPIKSFVSIDLSFSHFLLLIESFRVSGCVTEIELCAWSRMNHFLETTSVVHYMWF